MQYFIYKLFDKKNIDEFYIGSTTKISTRKAQHKKNTCNKSSKHYWTKLYQYIRANGGFENFEFVVLEEGECDPDGTPTENKNYILKLEQSYINVLEPTLNVNKAKKDKVELILIEF